MNNEVYEQISQSHDLIIELQRGLTSRPAISPINGGVGEYNKYLWIREVMQNMSPDIEIEDILVPDDRVPSKIRPSLIASIKGIDTTRTLWFITHLDVVPEGERSLWQTEPFNITVDGDKIYGRGCEDNQQSMVSSIIAIKSIIDKGIQPAQTVKLMFVADEEVGSGYGVDWILNNRRDMFKENDLIITPDVGDMYGEGIEIAEKSILWAVFRVIGEQSHGSRPDKGINASRAAAHLTIRLDNLRYKYNAIDNLFDIPYSTFEPTRRIGSVNNMNTIPGEEILGFDCRVLPQYKIDDVYNDMKSIASSIEAEFGVKIEVSTEQYLQSAKPTSTSDDVYVRLSKAVKKMTGVQPRAYGIGGGTVAAYFRDMGIPAALWSTVDNTMHAPNEYSSINNTIKDAKVFACLCMNDIE